MKDLLLEGCKITYSYKDNPEDWVGQVSIYIFEGGFGMVPHVVIDGASDHINYRLDELDEAIRKFKEIAFSPKNLWYKHNEAMRTFTTKDQNFDLEDPDDFRSYEKLRLEIVEKAKEKEAEIPLRLRMVERYGVDKLSHKDSPDFTEEEFRKLQEVKQSPASPEVIRDYKESFLEYMDGLQNKNITPSMEKSIEENDSI